MSATTFLIKRLRDAGLSQTEIKRRTGIPQSRLSRWEGGRVPPAADDALKLASLAEEVLGSDEGRGFLEGRRSGKERRQGPSDRREGPRRADDRADDIAAGAVNPGA